MKKDTPDSGGFKTEEMLKEEARQRREQQARLDAQKPSPPPSKKKAENFWYHYKWHTIGGAFFLAIVLFFARDVLFSTNPDFTVVITMTTPLPAEAQDALQEALEAAAFDRNGDGKVAVSLDYIYMPAGSISQDQEVEADDGDGELEVNALIGGQSDYTAVMKLTTVVAASMDPLYLVDAEMYRYFERMANPTGTDEDGNPLPADPEAEENSMFDPLPIPGAQEDRLPFPATSLGGIPGGEYLADTYFVLRPPTGKKGDYSDDCLELLRAIAG